MAVSNGAGRRRSGLLDQAGWDGLSWKTQVPRACDTRGNKAGARHRHALNAQGMDADGPRLQARFTTARPSRERHNKTHHSTPVKVVDMINT